jgi:outer membrane protein assembly factor BamB
VWNVARILVLATLLLTVVGCSRDHSSSDPAKPARNAVSIVATEATERRGDYQRFHTEKDFEPPAIELPTPPAKGTSPGYIFLTPRAANAEKSSGPTILDSTGRLVWFLPRPGRVTSDLKAQTFKGKPVLTWGERAPVVSPPEIFEADPKDLFYMVADQNYKPFLRVRAIGKGVGTDMHEFVITKRGTVLMFGFRLVTRDLTSLGGVADGHVVDSLVQEIDLNTGKLVFNWSALEHIPMSDSIFPVPENEHPWETYHSNSISETSDGNLLVSMRHTSAIYKIDRKTGKVLWTLGGKHSDFTMGPGTTFYYQHDAQPLGDGKILLFDNGSSFTDRRHPYSRLKVIKLDGAVRTAALADDVLHDRAILAVSQGNARRLENGNYFIGWGNREYFSEYTPEGQQLFDGKVPTVAYQSYRAFKGNWSGQAKSKPKIVADRTRGRTLIWVSWNGATAVKSWRVLGGPTQTTLKPLGVGDREGFETRLDVAAAPRVVRVQALDGKNKVLATSAPARPGT